jgi:hypothetical protein
MRLPVNYKRFDSVAAMQRLAVRFSKRATERGADCRGGLAPNGGKPCVGCATKGALNRFFTARERYREKRGAACLTLKTVIDTDSTRATRTKQGYFS